MSQSLEGGTLYCKPCPKLSDVDISIPSSFHSHFTSLSAICHCLSLQCWHSESSELSCSDDKFASCQLCLSLAQPVPVHTGPTSPLARTLLQKKHLKVARYEAKNWSTEHPTEHDDIMGYAGVWSSNLGRGSSKSVIPFRSVFYRLLSCEEVPENTRQQWMFLLFFPFFFAYSFFFRNSLLLSQGMEVQHFALLPHL